MANNGNRCSLTVTKESREIIRLIAFALNRNKDVGEKKETQQSIIDKLILAYLQENRTLRYAVDKLKAGCYDDN
jgi:hypothetical protein